MSARGDRFNGVLLGIRYERWVELSFGDLVVHRGSSGRIVSVTFSPADDSKKILG